MLELEEAQDNLAEQTRAQANALTQVAQLKAQLLELEEALNRAKRGSAEQHELEQRTVLLQKQIDELQVALQRAKAEAGEACASDPHHVNEAEGALGTVGGFNHDDAPDVGGAEVEEDNHWAKVPVGKKVCLHLRFVTTNALRL